MNDNLLIESLCRYIGQTVTIFTTSGGTSGCGFTGVLAAVTDNTVKLITDIGAAPSCPIGSNCSGCCNNNNCGCNGNGFSGFGNSGNFGGFGGGFGGFGGFGNFGGNCGGGCGGNNDCGCDNGCNNNWLGSVTEIPICKIASFTHNAI